MKYELEFSWIWNKIFTEKTYKQYRKTMRQLRVETEDKLKIVENSGFVL